MLREHLNIPYCNPNTQDAESSHDVQRLASHGRTCAVSIIVYLLTVSLRLLESCNSTLLYKNKLPCLHSLCHYCILYTLYQVPQVLNQPLKLSLASIPLSTYPCRTQDRGTCSQTIPAPHHPRVYSTCMVIRGQVAHTLCACMRLGSGG